MMNRIEIIKLLKENGYNFVEIGELLNLSKQRVFQLYYGKPYSRTEYWKEYACKNRYGGNGWKAKKRDNFQCQFFCGRKITKRNRLCVLHKNGDTSDNRVKNLLTVCIQCLAEAWQYKKSYAQKC